MRVHVKAVTQPLENIGRGVEATPGFPHLARFLDQVTDGFVFAIALMWVLRWWFVLCAVGIVLAGLE